MPTVYGGCHEQKGISVKLSLRNIAKVEQADIEINGITLITGIIRKRTRFQISRKKKKHRILFPEIKLEII